MSYDLDSVAQRACSAAKERRTRVIPLDEQLALWQAHRPFFGAFFDLCYSRWEAGNPKYGDAAFWMTDEELIAMLNEERADALNYSFMLAKRHLVTEGWYDGAEDICDRCRYQSRTVTALCCDIDPTWGRPCSQGDRWEPR